MLIPVISRLWISSCIMTSAFYIVIVVLAAGIPVLYNPLAAGFT